MLVVFSALCSYLCDFAKPLNRWLTFKRKPGSRCCSPSCSSFEYNFPTGSLSRRREFFNPPPKSAREQVSARNLCFLCDFTPFTLCHCGSLTSVENNAVNDNVKCAVVRHLTEAHRFPFVFRHYVPIRPVQGGCCRVA